MKNTNKKAMKTVAVMTTATLALSATMLLTGCGCANNVAVPTQATEPTASTVNPTQATESKITATEANMNNTPSPTTAKGSAVTPTEKPASNTPKATEPKSSGNNSNNNSTPAPTTKPSGGNSSSKPSGGGNSSQGGTNTKPNTPADPHAGKTYHEAVYKTVHHDAEYKDVYVVDQEAYSYEKPIYEERVYTICHVCGAEFDTTYDGGNAFFAHDEQHVLNDEGSGYHNEVRKIQIGSETVNVPEEGHYEKKVVKAAWDEKVLVKEAGWY